MAIQTRNKKHFNHKLIHHSDRGTQYRSLEYTAKLDSLDIQISMGYSCFDNAFMESANNIVKNEYLMHRQINSLDDLTKQLPKDIRLYNEERPHGSLNLKTPVEFERDLINIPICQRTQLPIFTDKSKKHKLLLFKPDDQQLRFQF